MSLTDQIRTVYSRFYWNLRSSRRFVTPKQGIANVDYKAEETAADRGNTGASCVNWVT